MSVERDWLSVEKVSEKLNIPKPKIYDWIRDKKVEVKFRKSPGRGVYLVAVDSIHE